MSTKFTPGPWKIGEGLDDDRMVKFISIEGPTGESVCDLQDNDNAVNDARLIADVPAMLDLLRELAEREFRWRCSDDWCEELLPKLLALVARHEEDPDAPG